MLNGHTQIAVVCGIGTGEEEFMQSYPKKNSYVIRRYYDFKFKEYIGHIIFYVTGNINTLDGNEYHTNRAKVVSKYFNQFHKLVKDNSLTDNYSEQPKYHFMLELNKPYYDVDLKMSFINKEISKEELFLEQI